MIQEIQLSNFKAFADTVKIPIKPITLIFGANSSGKSSIFQALLMLKQTLEESVSGDQSLLPKGKLVDLGNFREFIHNHDESRLFSVTFKIAPPIDLYDAIPTEDYISQNKYDSDRMNNLGKSIKSLPLGLTVSFSCDDAKGIHVTKLDLLVGDDQVPIITYVNEPPESIESLADDADEEVKRLRARQWRIYRKSPKSYFKFKKFEYHEYWKIYFESIKEHQYWSQWKDEFGLLSAEPQKIIATLTKEEQDLVSHLAKTNITRLFTDDFLTLSKFLPIELNGCEPQYLTSDDFDGKDQDNISVLTLAASFKFNEFLSDCVIHLGPARPSPERIFFFSGNISSYVGKNGQYTSESLDTNPELVKKVNKQLSRLNIGYKVKIVQLASDSSDIKVSTIRLISDSGIDLAITDVGYGISQVLPIIVQSILSKKKTIFIEQPELHLHPAPQAELGDLFINAALGDQKNTFIIETHSEHLILRLMRRMRETANGNLPVDMPQVSPNDVSILYVQPTETGSVVRVLELDAEGQLLDPWPGGFFEEGFRERFS